MHTEPIPSFDEFRAWVLAAYAPLMRSMGFVELPGRQGKGVTCFTVRLQNATTIIEVEGIHYGTAAWTKVFRASDKEETGAGLPIYRLLQLRQGLTAKQHRRRNRQGQLAEVEETAAAIIKHAGDVLLGDFSELERLAETERLLQRKRLEKALPREEKAAAVAASEAGHAFKRGDYAKVVELLEPHLAHLSPSQRRRYAVAKAGSQH